MRTADDSASARRALADLCTDYWYPLYAFARQRGSPPQDAEDLTQGLFVHVVEKNLFALAQPQLGRLRTFLLHAFIRYIGHVQGRERAQKRGGGAAHFRIDAALGEERFAGEPADPMTPQKMFERAWAYSVIELAMAALRDAESKAGRGAQFRELSPLMSHEPGAAYAAAAQKLGMSDDAAYQAVSRLKKKFRTILRRQIADTLSTADAAQIDTELAALRAALAS